MDLSWSLFLIGEKSLNVLFAEEYPWLLGLWQAFVGVRVRRIEGYYGQLLAPEGIEGEETDSGNSQSDNSTKASTQLHAKPPEKWKGQIEKDLPRTFPGHPALDEDGRNALRRLLTAYARHNPSVGYCQAMNFFAGLLLLLMPEENAFWTLVGIIDDYFDGYYSEEMIESQVDQLVYEELVRERFPKLVSHLDYLGVQVAWVTGPWFLSIFVNMLPWESVLRVWDVLLFDGNRVMLFRTALAIMELYGPALVTTKDAGDAVTLLQSLAGSTFDSSQLVLTACMGYQAVTEEKLRDLLIKHRPEVMAAIDERSKELGNWRVSQGLATKLYSFKRDPGSLRAESAPKEGLGDMHINGDMCLVDSATRDLDELINGLNGDDSSSVPDLQEQVVWLKVELCKLLEEKRSAILRAEELETALMEMVKQDNRRLLSAKVEQLEQEVAELRQALADKQEQEHAMIQVLMRVEQEQRVTEDARRFAEQDAAAQRYAANVLQEKYEEAMASLAQMEKRVVMAESMLEATLQYQSSQVKAQIPSPSPRSASQETTPLRTSHETMQEIPARKPGLLSRPFGLGWRERNKGKPSNTEEPGDAKTHDEEHLNPAVLEKDINGH
ncbi:EVI5-like protein isoform X2 [Amborella trichopoda]|uniref:EVI5-like protein isoform X2 n=1 Tax=Amborella trichopoda TaxID=13333 RepID=UPI0009BF948D|nr:EVI5-like protein isoform X2 [Amborella trichopoda]|eukprot:XP_020529991.1 EVI5-like protein isoform X2 [Amborella trichopoda]